MSKKQKFVDLDLLAKTQGYKDSTDKVTNFKGFKGNDKHLIPISHSNWKYHQSPAKR
jgi:hypothetical protein